jgi:hypothetical protein
METNQQRVGNRSPNLTGRGGFAWDEEVWICNE